MNENEIVYSNIQTKDCVCPPGSPANYLCCSDQCVSGLRGYIQLGYADTFECEADGVSTEDCNSLTCP
jgi:hypothetical protein